MSHTPPPQPPPSVLPDQLPMPRPIDPGSLLGFRTPLAEHPPAADAKAAALLTILGILFTVLGRYSGQFAQMLVANPLLSYPAALLLATFAALAMGTVVQAFRTLSPRFPKAPPSLAFFGDIARLSREEYVLRVEALTPAEALAQILSYNHTLSTICVEKFRQMRRALRLFKGAFLAWLMLMAVLAVKVATGG